MWCQAVVMASGLTPTALGAKFRPGDSEDSGVFRRYGRGENRPEPEVIDAVEVEYPGTAPWARLRLWQALGADQSRVQFTQVFDWLPEPLNQIVGCYISGAYNVELRYPTRVLWDRRGDYVRKLARVEGGASVLLDALALLVWAARRDERTIRPHFWTSLRLLDRLVQDPVIEPFADEFVLLVRDSAFSPFFDQVPISQPRYRHLAIHQCREGVRAIRIGV